MTEFTGIGMYMQWIDHHNPQMNDNNDDKDDDDDYSQNENANDGILIYGKYCIIINKNIINYNEKLMFKILYCNIKII